MSRPSPRTLEDIKSRSTLNENGCWIWNGSKCGPGYGESWDHLAKRKIMAHRLSFMLSKGPIPSHLEIDHTCNVRPCVNPDHLQLLTHKENCSKRDSKKTHCKQGHPWINENIYAHKRGRVCKICMKACQFKFRLAHPLANRIASKKYYNSVTKIRNRQSKELSIKRFDGGNIHSNEGVDGNF